ncbi:twin-arginine translocation signal domain-containing protein [Kutzneria kofuensis]|uniref:twin-arginine translocation signal domain-containing protein n=1 Tax=Kutzneria kofuensis TaxID=103725 RepID=UPI0031EB1201
MAPILGKPVSRRSLLRTAGAITGALGTLALLQDGAIVRSGWRWPTRRSRSRDVQFDLSPYMPPAVTYDGIPVGMPPVHTVFLTATLSRIPSSADQSRMESALRTIEANYPYAPGGVFTHVSYSDNYSRGCRRVWSTPPCRARCPATSRC